MALQREAGRPADTLADVWPNLSLLVHGGVSFAPYRNTFREIFGKPVATLEVYPASEGFIGVQDRIGAEDLLLMMDTGIFYEFVPVEELESDSPRPLHRGRCGNRRELRHRALHQQRSLELRHRRHGAVHLAPPPPYPHHRPHEAVPQRFRGEHLIVEEVETAIAEACKAESAEVQDFHVCPLFATGEDKRPQHQWLIEFLTPPGDPRPFPSTWPTKPCGRRNDDYAAHRQGDAGMRPPQLVALPSGTFYRAMKAIGKLGGQNKVPRLSNARDTSRKSCCVSGGRRLRGTTEPDLAGVAHMTHASCAFRRRGTGKRHEDLPDAERAERDS